MIRDIGSRAVIHAFTMCGNPEGSTSEEATRRLSLYVAWRALADRCPAAAAAPTRWRGGGACRNTSVCLCCVFSLCSAVV